MEAVAGPRLVTRAYVAALEQRYRWHEFVQRFRLSLRPRLILPGYCGRFPDGLEFGRRNALSGSKRQGCAVAESDDE